MATDFPVPTLMILLREPFVDSAQVLQAYLRETLDSGVNVAPGTAHDTDFIVTWNDVRYAVQCQPQPAALDTFAMAMKTNSGLADAEAMVTGHRAHIIIYPLQNAGRQLESIFLALGVMTIADLLAIKSNPWGFYWCGSEVLAANKQFADYTDQANNALARFHSRVPDALYDLPTKLWVGLRFFSPDKNRLHGVITKGLDVLTGFEIQIAPHQCAKEDIARHVLGMAAYLLANGPVFEEGSTLGMAQGKRFAMNLVPAKPGLPARWIMSLLTDEQCAVMN